MPRVGIYTATENELGVIDRVAENIADELVVRSASSLEEPQAIADFERDLLGPAASGASTASPSIGPGQGDDHTEGPAEPVCAAILWLHGGKESMPGYEQLHDSLVAADIPVIVKSTGDAFALEDTTVDSSVRDTVYEYLDRGGTANVTNCIHYLVDAVLADDRIYDEPVVLPTEGVYHPDHPGIDYTELKATLDPDTPTVGVWFYESHWTHENVAYVDALVAAIESQGADAVPVFCNPAGEEADEWDAETVAEKWLIEDTDSGPEPIVDAVCSSFMFSLSMEERGRSATDEGAGATDVFLDRLGVPVIQTITTMRSRSRYQSSDTGVMGFELALSVALPEFDGPVITHPISGKESAGEESAIAATVKRHLPIADRVDHAARLAVNWARLRHVPPEEKTVAVVLHNYPPSDEGIGTAFGLDTPASTVSLLEAFANRGYDLGAGPGEGDTIPADGQALIDRLTSQLTLDDRWIAPADIREKAVDIVSPERYREYCQDVDDRVLDNIIDEWGPPPDRPVAIPGITLGNVLVTVQPPRGFSQDPESIYHDADLWPPHEYLAFYRFLCEDFAADAVVHLGTHGSLEWLPGKTVGLDGGSAPDALIDDIPNVYPYIVNNPGEGTQAKRRSYATIVDHLTPPMTRAGTYDELADLEELIDQYRRIEGEQRDAIESRIYETVAELDLEAELNLDLELDLGADLNPERELDQESTLNQGPERDLDAQEGGADIQNIPIEDLVGSLHSYLNDIRTTQIRNGLHTLSEPPTGADLVEYLVALTRLPNADAPSLREAVAGLCGFDAAAIDERPGEYDPDLGMEYGAAGEVVYERCQDLVATLADHDFEYERTGCTGATGPSGTADCIDLYELVETIDPLGSSTPQTGAREDCIAVLSFICDEATPRVRGARDEIPRTVTSLAGGYVPPGGSGAPTRGGVDLLPTGRNFYTLDPRKVPAQSAYTVGRDVAEGVVDRHLAEEGSYPEEVGVVAWGTPTIRTRGETIAQILALMGVRPVWTEAGRIDDVEPIPLSELDRPRIDVTTRVSGLFRDAFPQAAGVIQDAVEAVVDLDEPHEENYVKKHVEEAVNDLTADGLDIEAARDRASHRVFTTKPGGYGAGTNKLVEEGNWTDREDLSEAYVQWGGYAMDSRGSVSDAHEAFEQRLGSVEATVKLEDTAEQDEFDSGDWYAFHGGFVSAVATIGGKEPASYVGDASNPEAISIYTNEEKVRKTMRARVLNPRWLESMEDHGYKGAGDLAKTVEVALGWDATTAVVSDTLWESIADRYALEEDRQDWMREVNPWALSSIADTLLEAIDRGLWDADEEMETRLQDLHLDVEGDLEARGVSAGTQEVPSND